MAKTALTELQERIEAIRREAYAAGYAAAMQSIREFAQRAAPGAAPVRGRPRRAVGSAGAGRRAARSGTPTARRSGRTGGRRPQRGTNARLIEEVLQSNAPRALRPAEIRSTLQRDKGVVMAFTSIRHALGQLEERHTAEHVANSKTWRYSGSGSAAAG